MKTVSFVCLCLGFLLLFGKIRWLERAADFLKKTQAGLEEAARQRSLANRQNLLRLERKNSRLLLLERELNYAGLSIKFPFLSVELWIAGNVMAAAAVFLAVLLPVKSAAAAGTAVLLLFLTEILTLRFLRAGMMKRVNNNLLKLLDFLGNYSITAGEITGIFSQISKYMEEPLRSALDACSYEAQLTGDVNLALLSMAEKIEHPKFKELARNLEISIRYTADFTALVSSSRKNMREYLRNVEERRSMLREGLMNLLLLFGLSLFVLITVDRLIASSVWQILFHTLPGRIAIGAVLFIFLSFLGKLHKLQS